VRKSKTRRLLLAFAILALGSLLSGCFIVPGRGWHDHREEHWDRR
jgi:hypothetical protein